MMGMNTTKSDRQKLEVFVVARVLLSLHFKSNLEESNAIFQTRRGTAHYRRGFYSRDFAVSECVGRRGPSIRQPRRRRAHASGYAGLLSQRGSPALVSWS